MADGAEVGGHRRCGGLGVLVGHGVQDRSVLAQLDLVAHVRIEPGKHVMGTRGLVEAALEAGGAWWPAAVFIGLCRLVGALAVVAWLRTHPTSAH